MKALKQKTSLIGHIEGRKGEPIIEVDPPSPSSFAKAMEDERASEGYSPL
jgi:hypothetical protein